MPTPKPQESNGRVCPGPGTNLTQEEGLAKFQAYYLCDLIEAGAWRGGATIFMRAILKTYGVTNRTVWVAEHKYCGQHGGGANYVEGPPLTSTA